MKLIRSTLVPALLLPLIVLVAGCQSQPTATLAPTPTATATAVPKPTATPVPTATPSPPAPTPSPLPPSEIKYRLLATYPDFFWCDPDFYPIARQGQEERNSIDQFPAIQADAEEFPVILRHLGLPGKAVYTNDEKLQIYREHKKLEYIVQIQPSGDVYNFSLRTGQDSGFRIEGTVSHAGRITELKKETSFNTCPICMAEGTLIDTPDGRASVESLRTGMIVWTVDSNGARAAAELLEAASTPVPTGFRVVKVVLSDGRSVTASPGHPTADGRALGDLSAGDLLDGAPVESVEYAAYDAGRTYDVLPAGSTGLYWANGIPLRSTLPTRR